jgi:hypothetical protein
MLMQNHNISFVRGEYPIGQYSVRLAIMSRVGWTENGPRLRALVTNRRLILIPDGMTQLKPASIPVEQIKRAWSLTLGKRDGMMISLKLGHSIYLFVEQGSDITQDLGTLLHRATTAYASSSKQA